jgi:alkyl sulfatase BDS1-like metallo-beta-lactamase superfamily hydrolase
MPLDTNLSTKGLRTADLVRSGLGQTGAIERAPGIWECRGVGNSYLVTTTEGNVLVNAGTLADGHRGAALFGLVSSNPVRSIVLTQSHANQYGGLEFYKTPENTVMAHRLYPEERAYHEALGAHYRRGSRRIFSGITGRTEELVPTREVVPDLLIGDEGYAFELGGRRFEIIWTPGGETRSSVIVWLPAERIAIVGNLFGPLFGNHPNLNTLRGDKPRSALEFIASVKKLRTLAPETILTGHECITGAAHIADEAGRIIDSVQWVHDQTVAGMNAGKDIRTLMREVTTPPELSLTEEYGKVAWNVRAIWHEYSGWFDPARGTTELYAVSPDAVAPALAALSGGANRLTECAREFLSCKLPLEALHVLNIALAAEPECMSAKDVKREALLMLNEQSASRNLWERMWIAAAVRDIDGTGPGGNAET